MRLLLIASLILSSLPASAGAGIARARMQSRARGAALTAAAPAAFDGGAVPTGLRVSPLPQVAAPPARPVAGDAAARRAEPFREASNDLQSAGRTVEAGLWSALAGLRENWERGPADSRLAAEAAGISVLLRRYEVNALETALRGQAPRHFTIRKVAGGLTPYARRLGMLGVPSGSEAPLEKWLQRLSGPPDAALRALGELRRILGIEEFIAGPALAEETQGAMSRARALMPRRLVAAAASPDPANAPAVAYQSARPGTPADWERSYDAALTRSEDLETRIASSHAALAGAMDAAQTAQIRARLESETADLKEQRRRLNNLSKLVQRRDLAGKPGSVGELARLDAILAANEQLLRLTQTKSAGKDAAEALDRAELEVLKRRVAELLDPNRPRTPGGPEAQPPLAGTPLEKEIRERLAAVEELQTQSQAELAQREAAARMLAVADRLRGGALRNRRNGRDQLDFQKNYARLAMVMDLSYSLNVLNAAEEAVRSMEKLLDGRESEIADRRDRSRSEGAGAAELAQRRAQWEEKVRDKLAAGDKNIELFAELAEAGQRLTLRLDAYRRDVKGLLEFIDARDRGAGAGAAQEYDRRAALLPQLAQNRRDGWPDDDGSVGKLSLRGLEEEVGKIDDLIAKIRDGERELDGVPVEFAGVLIAAVPGVPDFSVSNPDAAAVLALLSSRRLHWQTERADIKKILDGVEAMLDASNSKRVLDDFGDAVPESLPVYKNEQAAKRDAARADAARFAGAIDEAARTMAAAGAASLPTLSGRDVGAYRTLLPQYAEQLTALAVPDGADATTAQIEKIEAARLLPFLADAVIVWAQAEAVVDAIDAALRGVLPRARAEFAAAVKGIDAVLEDADADTAFVHAGFPPAGNQALIDRKKELLSGRLRPMLESLRRFLAAEMIPFQRDQIEAADPAAPGDSYAALFKEKKNLLERIGDSYFKTMPWSLASLGAAEGDAGGARANIDRRREDFREYGDLVEEFLDEIRRRKNPANGETEEVFGETMPFSLPKRIADLSAERARRSGEINALAAEVNRILADLDARTKGKFSLTARFSMPVGVSPDGSDSARLRAFIDARKVQDLAAVLRTIGDEGLAGGADGGLGVGGGGGGGGEIPTGEQPPLTLPDGQHTAILALDAVKRLVPSSNRGGGDSLTELIARYLFTNGVIEASRESLEEQIPIFEAFLLRAEAVLERVFADLDEDAAYVGGRAEGAEALFARKIAVYGAVADISGDGEALFRTKRGWDEGGFKTVADVASYYESIEEIHTSSGEALDAEQRALDEFRNKLRASAEEFAAQKKTVEGWLRQLNDPHESAMRRIADSLSKIQDRTRAVLESNIEHHKSRRRFEGSAGALQKTLRSLDGERGALEKLLDGVSLGDLPPDLADRIEVLGFGAPAWLSAAPNAPQTLIIKKSNFHSFLNQLFAGLTPESSARDILRLREALLADPTALAQLLPNTGMLEIGDDPDGFYLVYNSAFSTPHGLETESQVTLGNVLRLWDNNVSVVGHRFLSPPHETNAPYGDQGVTIRVESLQGENWVNYLDVTFHRLAQNIPDDVSGAAQMRESRMMVFEDFALMLADGKLYFGAAGFGDFSMNDPGGQPYFAGGNLKSSIKFNKIMSLNAEHAQLFAKDPRRFMQTVNLDFTGYDPGFDTDFVIDAEGEEKRFRRDKVGVGVDLQQALDTADSFKLDVFLSRVSGTDDLDQETLGATIVKGFAFEVNGVPVRTEVSGTGELGTEYNTGTVRASFELPEQGIVLSAEGKFLGEANTYLVELKKRMGTNTDVGVSYGSPHVGLNKRLTVGLNTTFTLGELWRSVAGRTGEDLLGGKTLAEFNRDLNNFFERTGVAESLVAELRRVFDADVGRKIMSLEIGRLTREIEELRKAGALLDNIKTRGFVGFVSNAVGPGTADRAAGGGFQVGTQTELTLTKTQREAAAKRVASLYAAGLLLQTRMLDLTQRWQAAVAEILEARWERDLALYMATHSPDETLAADGQARVVAAQARLHQARLRYNMLTGRPPEAAFIFEDAGPRDMDSLLLTLGKALAQPRPLTALFGRLAPGALTLPESSFNLMDWIPWVEQLTLWVGVQFKDVLANQVLGGGISIRLPIYDPYSARRDKAMSLEADAIMLEMYETYRETRLKAASQRAEAEGWEAQIALLAPEGPAASRAVVDMLRRYRNGLARQDELWGAMRRWYWIATRLLDARVRAGLKDAWARMDEEQADSLFERERRSPGSGAVADFDRALDAAADGDAGLAGLAKRSLAAAQLLEAAERRIERVAVDINIGANITASGIALLPAIGITGLGLYPIASVRMKPEDLRVLEQSRRGAEMRLAGHMAASLAGDLGLQFFSAYSAYEAGRETIALRLREPASLERDLALASLRAQQNQLRAALNSMLGRPLDAPLSASLSAADALAQFVARAARERALDSRLAALSERVRVARAVEEIVNKNLKVQDIRIEPVSLIGRSLGRLVAALSGSGDPSPELVARARHATLAAERELAAFHEQLGDQRNAVAYERRETERALRAAAGDPLRAVLLKNRLRLLDANLAMLGVDPATVGAAAPDAAPASFDALRERLLAAYRSRETVAGLADEGGFSPDPQSITAVGAVRYFHARKTIGSDPIDKSFFEGWVEVRLESRTTPPEALLALAALQRERADEIHRAAMARAESKAMVVLGRMRLRAALLLWARGRGPREAALARELETGLRRDLNGIAAMLGAPISLDGFLAMIPREESADPESAARAMARRIDETNIKALRSSLFPQGLPDGVQAANASLQLSANLIAERMSYKGFTPVGAFGRFRDKWVSGIFLQAPDPEKIQRSLEGILAEALRQELAGQDRMKALSLRLHTLMVAVADGAKLIEARTERLAAARRNLDGTLVLFERGSAGASDAAAAEAEVGSAWTELLATFAAVRMDFIRLVTELEALGQRSQRGAAPRRPSRPAGRAEEVVSSLADFLSGSMGDADFAARLDALFDGNGLVSKETRKRLALLADEYRQMKRDADLVRHHPGFTPEERLALLTKADVEGRRRLLAAEFKRLLGPLAEGPGAGRAELHRFLLTELQTRSARSNETLVSERALLERMTESLFREESAEMRAAFYRLREAKRRAQAARGDLFESYLEGGNKPEDFLIKDRALDAYLTAVAQYDLEVLAQFEARSPREARLLNSVFSLRESAERRRTLLTRGRGLLAANALIAIEESRLDAASWRRSPPDIRMAAAVRLSHLRGLRDRWLSDPALLPAVAAEVDSAGAVVRYLTPEDIAGLDRAGRLATADGARWILPPAHAGKTAEHPASLGARRIIEGADIQDERERRELSEREANGRRRDVERVLEKEPFALVGSDGTGRGGLTLDELRDLERGGRVVYFRKSPDRRSGLRDALHPVEARLADPDSIVAYVLREGEAGRYGSLEALLGSAEADTASRLETGRRGYELLAREAETQAREAQRAGWISLKLEAYAFSLDENGGLVMVFMNAGELEKARADEKFKEHSFHLAQAIRWGLSSSGHLAEVRIAGSGRVWRFGGVPARWIDGGVAAVQLDEDGALARVFSDDESVRRAARSWVFEDMSGRFWQPGREIAPVHRLRRYIDPKTGLPVLLGRSFLERRRAEAAAELDDTEGWATKPSNWPDIVLEIPRGIIQTPIEIITGRDPNQHHYIGRVYMYRGEGGATIRRGTFGRIVHFIDFLDILPDKVDRYQDPSQFPDRVRTDRSLLPGEWIYERDPRTADRDIHFGVGGLARSVRAAEEDLEDARGRILQSFRGGVRETFLETVRGRAGLYPNAQVRHRAGGSAIRGVLKDAGSGISPDGDGILSGRPGSVEVDRVRADLQVRIGAEQHAERAKAYREMLKRLAPVEAPLRQAVLMSFLPVAF